MKTGLICIGVSLVFATLGALVWAYRRAERYLDEWGE